jgi:hypothetical protein
MADDIARNAMAGSIETAELFDVDVDDLAGRGALVTGTGRLRLQRREQAKTSSIEDTRNAGFGNSELNRDLFLGAALTAQALNRIGR